MTVSLRPTTHQDVPTLFELQLDPDSNVMAGTKPYTEDAYRAVWDKILSDPNHEARVIVESDQVVGGISCFRNGDHDDIGYWIDKRHWGRGIATRALALLIREIPRRPLHATAAKSNAASIRVLQACGFRLTGYFKGEETSRYTAGECASFVLE